LDLLEEAIYCIGLTGRSNILYWTYWKKQYTVLDLLEEAIRIMITDRKQVVCSKISPLLEGKKKLR
jgi:hypothetical protein